MPRTLTRRRTARDTDAYSPAEDPEDDDQPQEDEKPTRGSRRGGRREALHTQEDKPSARRGSSRQTRDDDDDEEEEKPAKTSRRSRKDDDEPAPKIGGKGWGTYEKTKSANSGFPDDLKVTDEEILIKILDDEPFHVFLQHWIERKGKKSWTCLENKCPLCDDAGDKPSQQVCFNVIDFTDPKDPSVKIWRFGPMVADILHNFSKSTKTTPINRDDLYWSVHKEVKKNKTNYYIVPVKERDLDDWEMEPLSDEEFEEFEDEMYDETAFPPNTRSELREVAREILND